MREKRDEGKVLESKIKSVTPNSGQTLVSNKSNKSKAIRGFILLRLPKEIKLHTQCAFKSIKVKAHTKYCNDSTQTKGFVPQTCPKVFGIFARRPSIMKYNLNKIADMQYLC